MRDGRTRKSLEPSSGPTPFSEFVQTWNVSLVVLNGAMQGTDYAIEQPNTVMGRGPDVDLAFADDTLSRQHARLEFADGGLRLRDLGSLNGSRINGGEILTGDLKHGDRFQLGDLQFQLVFEERPRVPKTHHVAEG